MSLRHNLLLALLVLLSPVALAQPRQTPAPLPRPNILLLMAEDMSARVGAFGDAVAVTPTLDALAAQGVRYPNTFTTAGVCAPSRAAHILGRYQIATGTQHMRTSGGPLGSYRAVPPADAKAYPELLRAAGYYTYTDGKLDYQFSGTLAGSGPFTLWDDEGRNAHWRGRAPGQPFFGFVNFQVTHESGVFTPLGHWPHSGMHFAMQVMRALTPTPAPVRDIRPEQVILPPYYPDTATVRADIARHYRNIAVMDRQVADLLAQLKADGLDESTIVIWTADHGDGLPRAKRELYDSGIRVPMIIRWPQAYRPPGVAPGSVDTRLVSFVDIAPTVLRLAGAAIPAPLPGRDIVRGEPRQYIFAARDRIDDVMDRQRAVRDLRFKYIASWYPDQPGGHPLAYRDNAAMVRELRALYEQGKLNAQQRRWFEPPGDEQLYDTQADPFELHNLAADPRYAPERARLRGALDDWLARTGDWSEQPEADMVAAFQPGGEMPRTPAPVLKLSGHIVAIEASDGASIGYRIDGGPWRVYSAPLTLAAGQQLMAKAVRYGWQDSDRVELRVPR